MKDGLQKIQQAVDIIRKTRPVYATALMTMERIDDKEVDVMSTNGVYLKYNDAACALLPLNTVVFVLMHQVLHKWMRHPSRMMVVMDELSKKELKNWRIASDLAVNSLLYQQGEKVPHMNLYIPEERPYLDLPHGKTAEWYFDKIREDDNQEPDNGSDLIPSDEGDEIEQLQEVGVSVSAAKGQHAGKRSTDVITKVLEGMLEPPKLDYKAILRRYLTETTSHRKRSFARECRRGDGTFILPSYRKDKDLCRTCVVMDTSGSMDGLAQDVLYECVGFAKQYPNAIIEAVLCDTDVHKVYNLGKPSDVAKLTATPYEGGGGTDMTDGFVHAVKNKAKLIICLTDMEMSWPKNPMIPVVWVDFRSSKYCGKPPYGDVIQVKG